MAEDSKIILSSEDQSFGTIEVAPRVVEIIAGVAASEIDGVSKMYGSLANSFGELLGRSDQRRGVKLTSQNDNLTIDIDVYIDYGVSVPKLAAKIQDRVKQQMTKEELEQLKKSNPSKEELDRINVKLKQINC